MDGLTTNVVEEDGAIVIHVSGEIDIQTCERLRDVVEPHLGPAQTIVLDLSRVTFADSSMVNTIVQARGRLTEDGGSLVLRNPSDAVRRVLSLTEAESLVAREVERHHEERR